LGERVVLCFGDSNTWGCPPNGAGERFPRDVRWPGVLQQLLGDEYYVIEEGLNGRTATLEHPWVEGLSGRTYLLPCCKSHAPLDLVIIFLGTNELAPFHHLPAPGIAESCASLVRVVRAAECGRDGGTPPVLLVCPPPIQATGPNAAMFEDAAVKSQTLGRCFADAAAAVGAELLDLDGVLQYSVDDPIHLDADAHAALARALQSLVMTLAPPV
jgi:lysophospholipase L1-like esterase